MLGTDYKIELDRRLGLPTTADVASWSKYVNMCTIMVAKHELGEPSTTSHQVEDPNTSTAPMNNLISTTDALALTTAVGKLKTEFGSWIMYKASVQKNFIDNNRIEDELKKSLIRMTIQEGSQPYTLWASCIQGRRTAAQCWTSFVGFFESQHSTVQHILDQVEKLERVEDEYDVANLEKLSLAITNILAVSEKQSESDITNIFNSLICKLYDHEILKFVCQKPSIENVDTRVKLLHKRAFAYHKFSSRNKCENLKNIKQVTSIPEESSTEIQYSSIVLMPSQSIEKSSRICDLCSESGHFASYYPKSFTVEDHRQICLNKNLCLRCFIPGHSRVQCRRQVFCKLCRDTQHCTSAHDLFFNTDSQTVSSSSITVPSSSNSQSSIEDKEAKVIYSKSVPDFYFKAKFGSLEAKILPDTGADVSLISSNLAGDFPKLQSNSIRTGCYIPGVSEVINDYRECTMTFTDADGNQQYFIFPAYVFSSMKPSECIIGRDNLGRFLLDDSRKLNTILGSYDFSTQNDYKLASQLQSEDSSNSVPNEKVVLHLQIVRTENTFADSSSLSFYSGHRLKDNFMKISKCFYHLQQRQFLRYVYSPNSSSYFADACNSGCCYVMFLLSTILLAIYTLAPKKVIVNRELYVLLHFVLTIQQKVSNSKHSGNLFAGSMVNLNHSNWSAIKYKSAAIYRRFLIVLRLAILFNLRFPHVPDSIYSRGCMSSDFISSHFHSQQSDVYSPIVHNSTSLQAVLVLKRVQTWLFQLINLHTSCKSFHKSFIYSCLQPKENIPQQREIRNDAFYLWRFWDIQNQLSCASAGFNIMQCLLLRSSLQSLHQNSLISHGHWNPEFCIPESLQLRRNLSYGLVTSTLSNCNDDCHLAYIHLEDGRRYVRPRNNFIVLSKPGECCETRTNLFS